MTRVRRLVSSLLLAAGIVLVFAGMSALGFGTGGLVAAIGVIAALLYAGAVRFGPAPPVVAPAGGERVIVFDRSLHIVSGATPGTPLLSQFPAAVRDELEVHCRAALRGEHTHFRCEFGGRQVPFEVAPIHTVPGAVLYGVLIVGSGVRVPAPAHQPATTVA